MLGRSINAENIRSQFINRRCLYYKELLSNGYCKEVNDLLCTTEQIEYVKYLAIKDAYICFINNYNTEFPPELPDVCRLTGEKWLEIGKKRPLKITSGDMDIGKLVQEAEEYYHLRRAKVELNTNLKGPSGNPIGTRTVESSDMSSAVSSAEQPVETQKTVTANTQSDKSNMINQKMLDEAKIEYDRIIALARAEASRIQTEAEESADRIVAAARKKEQESCDNIKAEISSAMKQKSSLINEGESQKQNLIKEGELRKQDLIKEGKVEKQKKIESIAEQEYREKIEEYVKKHFSEEQLNERNIKARLDNEHSILIKEKNEILDGINNGAQNLYSSIMQSFEKTITEIQNVQNDIHNQLSSWRRNLYKSELQGLAICFISLDKIIVSIENKIVSHLTFGEDAGHKQTAEELSQIAKNLKILKSNLETSLARNSIKFFIPQVGDEFNSIYHVAENIDIMNESEDDFNGKPITDVSQAGIIRVFSSGDEVLFRAAVTIKK